MICSHCGADNKDDAVKCAKCGEALTSVPDKNIQKKSGAASRIRKISVDHGDFGSHREHRTATEHTLEDVMHQPPGDSPDEKKVNVEDTLDLSKFHLDRIQLEDDVQKDSDGLGRIGSMSLSESGGMPDHDKRNSGLGKNGKRNWFLWILIGVVLVAVLVATAVFIYLWKNPKKDYADIILEGNRYYQEEHYEKAEEMYFQALEMNPEGAEGYFCLADVYIAMDRTQKAAEILKKGYERTNNEQLEKRLRELTNDQKDSDDMAVPEESTQTEEMSQDSPNAKTLGEGSASDNGSNVIVWALDPSITAENIMPVQGCDPGEDTSGNDVSVIVQNGLAGLVNGSGQTVLDLGYCSIIQCDGRLYARMPDGSSSLIREDYTPDPESGHEPHQTTYSYLWDSEQSAVFRIIYTSEGTAVEEKPFQIGENVIVPVILGTRESYSLDHPMYGLASSQGLCTDFIYENTGAYSKEGMIAVCRSGLWGFCNAAGAEIVPCTYGTAEYMDMSSTKDTVSYTQGAPYAYSGGYAAVNRDGQWGFLDKEGNIAAPFIFEAARPVQGGQAWVKYQGKWGRILLSGPSDTDSVPADTSEHSEQTDGNDV